MQATNISSYGRAQNISAIAAANRAIDELIAGTCTERNFVKQVLLLEYRDADIVWEVLGRLDRLHRRRQIVSGVFSRVKSQLMSEYLGYGRGVLPIKFQARPAVSAASGDARGLSGRKAASDADVTPAAQVRLEQGARLKGRYRVEQVLSSTSEGLVLDAVDERRDQQSDLTRRVAVHVINQQRSQELELVQRVYRLQALSHPAILRMLDFDEEHGELFFTTEWLTATSLQHWTQRADGGLSVARVNSILGAVANALAHAHSRNVWHGDVRAANVLVTDTGEVRLQGFVVAGRDLVASAAADRLAFARMALEALSQREPATAADLQIESLQQPEGVSDECWRLLTATLLQQDDAASTALLAHFAGIDLPRPAPMLAEQNQRAQRQNPARRAAAWKAAASILVALTGFGGYLLLADGDDAEAAQPKRLFAQSQ